MAVVLVLGCGRSGLGLFADEDGPRSGRRSSGGEAGSSSPTGGNGVGGSPSGATAGGVAGSSAGAGSGGQPSPCDRDGDGHRSPSCGGDDCDDLDPSVHPGAWDTNAEQGPWITEFVFGDIQGDSRGRTSLAVDSDGIAHVAEGRNGLRYATNASGSWVSERIDEASTGVPSLALSPNDTVFIAYKALNEIRLATRGDSGWTITLVSELGQRTFSEGACSLAIDRRGGLHLAYVRSGGEVRYATPSDGTWNDHASFESSVTVPPKLALDARGEPHWIFGTPQPAAALHYATRCDAGFCASEVAPGEVMDADLAIDATGTVHLVYGFLSFDGPLTHGVLRNDGTWLDEMIAPSSSWAVDLGATPPGSPSPLHLAFLESFEVKVARWEPTGWASELVAHHGYGVSLAVEGPSVVHVAHTDFRFDVNTYVSYVTNRRLAPDGIDRNCDGVDGVDRDGDGHASTRTGGGDCDDRDPDVHPFSSGGAGGDAAKSPEGDSDCEGGDG